MTTAIFVLSIIILSLLGITLVLAILEVETALWFRFIIILIVIALSILGVVQGC